MSFNASRSHFAPINSHRQPMVLGGGGGFEAASCTPIAQEV